MNESYLQQLEYSNNNVNKLITNIKIKFNAILNTITDCLNNELYFNDTIDSNNNSNIDNNDIDSLEEEYLYNDNARIDDFDNEFENIDNLEEDNLENENNENENNNNENDKHNIMLENYNKVKMLMLEFEILQTKLTNIELDLDKCILDTNFAIGDDYYKRIANEINKGNNTNYKSGLSKIITPLFFYMMMLTDPNSILNSEKFDKNYMTKQQEKDIESYLDEHNIEYTKSDKGVYSLD